MRQREGFVGELLHPVRLFWDHGRGFARYYDAQRPLADCPLPGVTEMDYIPGVVAQARHGCDRLEDMTADEVRAAQAWLRAHTAA